MRNDTRERNQWKVRITDCVNQSSDVISQPVSKRMAEVMVGISGSGLVRAANQRHWLWRRSWGTAQQIARQLPLKHRGKLKKQSRESVRFGITTVSLKAHPDTPLSMIVVRHGRQQPLVLVSTERIRGRLQGERLIQSYPGRWACEEGYRFGKQGFGREKVQARTLATLQNLVALATLAWGLLACYQRQGQGLINKAKRQKSHKPLVFPFYTLLSGWQALFADAKTLNFSQSGK